MLWDVMEREVFERLERLGAPYFLTGSEALARYGQPRQTIAERHAQGRWQGFERE